MDKKAELLELQKKLILLKLKKKDLNKFRQVRELKKEIVKIKSAE